MLRSAPTPVPLASEKVCPAELALDVVACKWTVRIIYVLAHGGVLRFSVLKRELGSITHKELTKQLRRLEQHGLVTREVFAEVPPRVEYRLSPLGTTRCRGGRRRMRPRSQRIERRRPRTWRGQ